MPCYEVKLSPEEGVRNICNAGRLHLLLTAAPTACHIPQRERRRRVVRKGSISAQVLVAFVGAAILLVVFRALTHRGLLHA